MRGSTLAVGLVPQVKASTARASRAQRNSKALQATQECLGAVPWQDRLSGRQDRFGAKGPDLGGTAGPVWPEPPVDRTRAPDKASACSPPCHPDRARHHRHHAHLFRRFPNAGLKVRFAPSLGCRETVATGEVFPLCAIVDWGTEWHSRARYSCSRVVASSIRGHRGTFCGLIRLAYRHLLHRGAERVF